MGSVISRASDTPPPSTANASSESTCLVAAAEEQEQEEKSDKVDYTNLPCPVPYRYIHSEASRILQPTDFEGLRIILLNRVNRLNDRFLIAHKVIMESMDVPYTPEIMKVSTGNYEFGAFFIDPKLLLAGKIDTHGTLKARVRYNLTNKFTCNINAKLTNEPHCSYSAFRFGYKGKDYRAQFQFGKNVSCGASYIQSVTPNLSLGTQLIWLGDRTKSIIGFAARYNTNKMIATGRVLSDGKFSLSYVQNLSEKVSLASEFVYAHARRNVISSFGYEYKFRECLLRGKVDSNSVISSYLEKTIGSCTKLILFAEIDHVKKNYKFGYGLERANPTELLY